MKTARIGDIAFKAGRWPLVPDLPALLFIHCAGGTSVLWREQINALSDRANTLAVDLPGHGLSYGRAKVSIKAYARAMAEFLIALKPHRPVVCGHSMGGAIVQQLLLDHAEVLCAGILICTGARLRVLPSVLRTILEDYQGFIRTLGEMVVASPAGLARILPLLEATAGLAPATTYNDYRACDAFDVMGRLAAITHPVLIIAATDDLLTPSKYADYLAEHIPQASTASIDCAGHFVVLENPAAVNDAITGFLEQLPA